MSPRSENRSGTKVVRKRKKAAEILPEYDFRNGVRSRYAERHATATSLVLLEPDIAQAFPTVRTVNRALRELLVRHG